MSEKSFHLLSKEKREDGTQNLPSSKNDSPRFKSSIIEVVAKRAAFLCSNPDCQVPTIGPNANPEKSTVIGEAAHIRGARPDSARYDKSMSDVARSEITNAIWLCRNCHKIVDANPENYSAALLFSWREQREKDAFQKLGSKGDLTKEALLNEELVQFKAYPPVVRRIVIDKPPGWEWRLTAELMRHINAPIFRKLNDLRAGRYVLPIEHIEDEEVLRWVSNRCFEMSELVQPIEPLLDRLNESWGAPGELGDLDLIHHVCCLIGEHLKQVVQHEEKLRFTRISDEFSSVVSLLKDCIGSQVDKLAAIPDRLDEIVGMIEALEKGGSSEPITIQETISIELPPGWERKMSRELKKIENIMSSRANGSATGGSPKEGSGGVLTFLFWTIVIFVVLIAFF